MKATSESIIQKLDIDVAHAIEKAESPVIRDVNLRSAKHARWYIVHFFMMYAELFGMEGKPFTDRFCELLNDMKRDGGAK